jgi:hypothetical protein
MHHSERETWGFPITLQDRLASKRVGSVSEECREHLETEVDPRPAAIAG